MVSVSQKSVAGRCGLQRLYEPDQDVHSTFVLGVKSTFNAFHQWRAGCLNPNALKVDLTPSNESWGPSKMSVPNCPRAGFCLATRAGLWSEVPTLRKTPATITIIYRKKVSLRRKGGYCQRVHSFLPTICNYNRAFTGCQQVENPPLSNTLTQC
jgi:hypothetical protein